MKEIGGYFQLEEMPGEEYYPDLYRVNLGRTALLWLLKSRRCRKILLPYFLCESRVEVKIEACARSEGEMKLLISLLREEARVICDRRRLIITEEQISERVVKPGTPESVTETVTETTRVYGV